MPLVRLGALVERERKKFDRFKSRRALAKELGISSEHLRRIERGESKCSIELLQKILRDQLTVTKTVEDEAFWLWIQGQVPEELRHLIAAQERFRQALEITKFVEGVSSWLDDFYDVQLSDTDKSYLCSLAGDDP